MNCGESRCNSRGKEAELIAGEKFKAPDGPISLMLVAEKDNVLLRSQPFNKYSKLCSKTRSQAMIFSGFKIINFFEC
ncbi:MAG: hypothetical protein M3275_13990 [Thermoproteota archaeon]|jgi:hypothetical protein|nr:hypothetical protein [Thermoproteota archaeon]